MQQMNWSLSKKVDTTSELIENFEDHTTTAAFEVAATETPPRLVHRSRRDPSKPH